MQLMIKMKLSTIEANIEVCKLTKKILIKYLQLFNVL